MIKRPHAVDRHWTLVAQNRAVSPLLEGVDPTLLEGAVNVLRLSLHPRGLAHRIVNLAEWRSHLLARLRRQVEASADPILEALFKELSEYPIPGENNRTTPEGVDYAGVAVPFQFKTAAGILSFLSTTTVFGTPVDITLSELALESFFPADTATLNACWK